MRILTYLLLLVVLFLTSFVVLVATKDGKYLLERKEMVNVPKEIAINYVINNEYWKKKLNSNLNELPNDSVQKESTSNYLQNLKLNNTNTIYKISLKDTLKNKTIILGKAIGTFTLKEKILNILNGQITKKIEQKIQKEISLVKNFILQEKSSYKINIEGLVLHEKIYYIQKIINCKEIDIASTIKANLPELNEIIYCSNTESNGAAFITYHKKEAVDNKITFSLAIPTKEKITSDFLKENYYSGETNSFKALKAIFVGNYNYKQAAFFKISNYLRDKQIKKDKTKKTIEFIPINFYSEKSASNWVTEIYIPIDTLEVQNNDLITDNF